MAEIKMQSYISPDNQEHLADIYNKISDFIEEYKVDEARELLVKLHPADLAHYIDNSSQSYRAKLLNILGNQFEPEVLLWLDHNIISDFISLISPVELAGMLNKLDIEDAIFIVDEIEEEVESEVFAQLDPELKTEIKEGLKYPENSAGRLMSKNFISFPGHWTVGQAIESIRKKKHLPDDLHAAIVVDSSNKPIGILILSNLLRFSRNEPIKNITNDQIKMASPELDQEDLSYAFTQYALPVVPVTNQKGKLVGVIEIEAILEIVEQEAEEDIMHMGGVNDKDIYLSYFTTARYRFPWLFVNLITACLTAVIISFFETTIEQMAILAAIMPITASISGNAGTQTVTVAVRSIASKDIDDSNALKVIFKETIVCLINGVLISLVGGALLLVIFANLKLSLIFGGAVTFTCVISGLLGSAIPIILAKSDVDPAIASSIFLTAMTDAVGFFAFLGLAYMFMI